MKTYIVTALAAAGLMAATVNIWNPTDTPKPQIIRETIYLPAPTITSTSTTTTTTTTTTIPPVTAPARSELVRKVDELYPGASDRYGFDIIEKAGKFACARWNNAPITRLNVIRDIMEYTSIDDLQFGNAVSEAVVWTICWNTTSFPNGPREYR